MKNSLLITILTLLLVWGCTTEKAAVRVLKLSTDSEYSSRVDTVVISSYKFDTLTMYNHDTISIDNERMRVVVMRDTINNYVRIRGECKEVVKTVPVEVIKFVNKPQNPVTPWSWYSVWLIIGCVVAFVLFVVAIKLIM